MKSSRHVLLPVFIAIILIFLSGMILLLAASTDSSSRLRLDWSDMAYISAESVLAPADRSSPRAMMESFMTHMDSGHQHLKKAIKLSSAAPGFFHHPPEALEEAGRALFDFERAMHCLDLSRMPQLVRLQEAREGILLLKEILDRVGIPQYELIPGDTEVVEQKLVRWSIPKTEIRLYRLPSGEEEGSWAITPESVDELERTYRRVRHLPYLPGATENAYQEYLTTPGSLFPPKWALSIPMWGAILILEQTLWQWIALVVCHLVFVAALVISWVFLPEALREIVPLQEGVAEDNHSNHFFSRNPLHEHRYRIPY